MLEPSTLHSTEQTTLLSTTQYRPGALRGVLEQSTQCILFVHCAVQYILFVHCAIVRDVLKSTQCIYSSSLCTTVVQSTYYSSLHSGLKNMLQYSTVVAH